MHVLDGAMGTMLYSRGVFVNVCYDELNLKQPALVQEVHELYVRAGAEILETNTFGANPVKLSAFGLDERTEEINRVAGELAHRAARGRAAVVGAIGPLGIRIEPWGSTARTEAVAFFARQATGLAQGGVHGFILETFSDLEEIHAALEAARSVAPDLPVIAQMTVGEDGATSYGTSVETIAARLIEWGADVVGLNCSVGPAPDARGDRAHGGALDQTALGPAERGPPALGRRPADLPREPRLHGAVRPPADHGGSVVHRRMLRDHPRSHPTDQGVRRRVAAAASLGRGSGRTAVRAGGKPTGAAARTIRVGSQARERDVRAQRRAGASPGLGSHRR